MKPNENAEEKFVDLKLHIIDTGLGISKLGLK